MRQYIKSLALFEEDARSVSVPQTIVDDMDAVKDHCNQILLKPYGVRIDAFTFSSGDDGDIQFTGTPFVGKGLGVFGSVVQECSMSIDLTVSEQTARGPVKLRWTLKNGSKDSSVIGEYELKDGKTLFYTLDDAGNPIDGDPEEIGTSDFAVTTASVDINAEDGSDQKI